MWPEKSGTSIRTPPLLDYRACTNLVANSPCFGCSITKGKALVRSNIVRGIRMLLLIDLVPKMRFLDIWLPARDLSSESRVFLFMKRILGLLSNLEIPIWLIRGIVAVIIWVLHSCCHACIMLKILHPLRSTLTWLLKFPNSICVAWLTCDTLTLGIHLHRVPITFMAPLF